MLNQASLHQQFWRKVKNRVNYYKNRSSTVVANNKTPFEAWTGVKTDLQHMKKKNI